MTDQTAKAAKLDEMRQCMQRVAEQRDKSAFAQLFDHYAPLIRSYSLAREPAAELVADDLVQEVMTRMWVRADRYNPAIANLNTWVFTLARNCRIDYLRRNGRYASEIDPTDLFEEIEDEAPGPWQRAYQDRVGESIRAGLDQIPSEQADILVKVYLEGKSHQEVSDELRLPLGTVKSRVRLALQKLRTIVNQ